MAAELAEKPEAPVKAKREPLKILRAPTRANVRRIEWDVIVPIETTFDDLLDPTFWGHVAGSTFNGPINYVNVHWEDKTKLAHLYVTDYSSTFAKMEVLEKWTFGKTLKMPRPEIYQVDWAGPESKHRVIRKADSQLIRDGFKSKEEAAEFIKSLPQ